MLHVQIHVHVYVHACTRVMSRCGKVYHNVVVGSHACTVVVTTVHVYTAIKELHDSVAVSCCSVVLVLQYCVETTKLWFRVGPKRTTCMY